MLRHPLVSCLVGVRNSSVQSDIEMEIKIHMEKITKHTGFIQLKRNEEVFNLIRKRPSAFLLLTLIAFRARRTKENQFDGLEIGEAYIGDFKSYCATQQIYRTDKKFLETNRIITTKATNKGTIAKLVGSTFFDINAEELATQPTNNQRAANEQPTTNNNDNNVKNANNTNNKSRLEINESKSLPYKGETHTRYPEANPTLTARGMSSIGEIIQRKGVK